MTNHDRFHILISAYACEPDEGSEQEVGWKWAQEMAKECEVTVITRSNSRSRIETWQEAHPGQMRAIFLYLDLGGAASWLKKRIPGGLYFYYYLWQWKLRKMVKDTMHSGGYDLIHHVTFASFRMPVGATGLPMVWGPVGGAERASASLLKGHGTWTGRMRERIRNASTVLAGRLIHLWAPVSRSGGIALASTPATFALLQRSGIRCEMMPTIGYDSPALREKAIASPDAPLRLLYVGRLHLLKGVHLILRAIAKLSEQPVCLTLVGDGPERQRLERLTLQLGLDRRVSFCGHVPRNELGDVYAGHDVLIAPSLYESGGLSILEGFAHGLPAIVLDCGGPALSVTEGCGIKVPSNLSQSETVARLAQAIDTYLKDRSLTQSHGANAMKQVSEHYAWPSKRTKMLEVYQRLMDGDYEK